MYTKKSYNFRLSIHIYLSRYLYVSMYVSTEYLLIFKRIQMKPTSQMRCLKLHTTYLIIGEGLGRLPITNIHLKTIEFYQVSFEDGNEVLVLLHLVTHSPNLKELKVSTSPIQPFPLEEESSDLFERDCFYYKPGLKLCG
ncbi:hypothetical protein HID58_043371 [Brassica napus]|uniref:BnaC01g31040D protein n=2 Tax=Brassica napus TaxID=3708 RepID=A0A078F788_BRANA|nr:hypothetical protein HID58_043371 [Brassica napus]CAF2076632.1 unnamed protein product [Brassica napus]CDY08987.1 BnaC01g31040D [Brassica napus]